MGAEAELRGRKVVLALESLESGGAERQALLLARGLRETYDAVPEIWGLFEGGALELPMHAAGIGTVCGLLPRGSGWLWTARAVARLRPLLLAAQPRAVIGYTMWPAALCALAAGDRLPVYWSQRDAGLVRAGRTRERLAARRTRAFIANGRAGAEFLATQLGVPSGRISLVPNGVAAAAGGSSRGAWRGAQGFTGDEFLIGMLANLHGNKDHETLLRAFAGARGRWPDAARPPRLLLAGREGDAAARLRILAAELGVVAEVRFIGPLEDRAGFLSALDLAAFSSRSEGSPNGVLEAMAAGLAVAATDLSAIRDLVGDVGAPLLAPPGDAPALAERILRAAGQSGERERIGAAMRQRALSEFSVDRMVSRTAEVLASPA